jgi:mannose-1-phosphate guanylyltransferase
MLVPLKKTMNKCDIMVFAAGLGTRLRPATNQNPKPVIPLNGIPLGYYVLPYLENLHANQFIVNTFHLPDQIHNLYKPIYKNIHFSNETEFIKGSAGGLKCVENKFSQNFPIVTVNADEILFSEQIDFLDSALQDHQKNNHFATLIVTEHPEAGQKFGAIWCQPNTNKVIHIGKDKPNDTAKPWHFIGIQILSAQVLKLIAENIESNIFYDVLIHQLNSKNICIFPIQCDWYEVGNISDYKIAKDTINIKLKSDPVYQNHYAKLNHWPKSKLSDLTE